MDELQLLDWRRRMAELFAELRRRPPDAASLAWFRAQKDELFSGHPQSPLPESARAGARLSYWAFDAQARVTARFEPQPAPAVQGEVPLRRIGRLHFAYAGRELALGAFWVEGYAGGLFVPFRDETCGHETYGGGRYLLDTI